jgi:hypothetical protein
MGKPGLGYLAIIGKVTPTNVAFKTAASISATEFPVNCFSFCLIQLEIDKTKAKKIVILSDLLYIFYFFINNQNFEPY